MKALDAMSLLFDTHSAKVIAIHLLHGICIKKLFTIQLANCNCYHLDDLDVLGGLHPDLDHTSFRYQEYYRDRGVTSGIELCTLPNGEQLRLDLLER